MLNAGYLRDGFQDTLHKNEIIEIIEQSKLSLFYRKITGILEPLSIWYSSLKTIEKNCGCAVSSYFQFITWLMRINLWMFAIFLTVLLIPFLIKKPESFSDLIIDGNFTNNNDKFTLAVNCTQKAYVKDNPMTVKVIIDILNGKGLLVKSPMFIGYYFNISYFNMTGSEFTRPLYNTPVAYCFAFWLCIISSFIITIYSSGTNYKLYKIDEDEFSGKFGLCLLTGFDYGVTKKNRILAMRNDLTKKLKIQYNQIEEFNYRSKLPKKSAIIKAFPKIVVNIIFIGFLCLIYFVIVEAQDVPIMLAQNKIVKSNAILVLLKDYVPSVTVAMINVVFQIINTKVVRFENYTKTVAVEVCFIRLILVQVISLLIFMVSLLDQTSQSNITDKVCQQTGAIKCWENFIGQQFYRYSLLLFFSSVFVKPLIQLLQSVIFNRFGKDPDSQNTKSKVVKLIGTAGFDLSEEGFVLINAQCVCWMGFWFCPFLLVLMLLNLFLLFYIRKAMFLRNLFETKMETATVAGGQKFLLGMLLNGLAFIMLPMGYILSNKSPSRGCSPFRIYDYPGDGYSFTTFLVEFFTSQSKIFSKIWNFVTSLQFFLPVLGVLIIITYVKYAQAKTYSRSIQAIRKEILNEENNLLFYEKQMMNAKEIDLNDQILLQSR